MSNPLKEWRGDRPQHEAARLLETDTMTYSRWERGIHLPRKSKWSVIKRETGIEPARLLELVAEGSDQ